MSVIRYDAEERTAAGGWASLLLINLDASRIRPSSGLRRNLHSIESDMSDSQGYATCLPGGCTDTRLV